MPLRQFFLATIRRKMFFSFSIVVILVVVLAAATSFQLGLVRNLSRQITPASLRLAALQEYALALSDFEGNFDRLFVIGGHQFEEAVQKNLETMNDALVRARENVDSSTEADFNELTSVTRKLTNEVSNLLNLDLTQLSSREANETAISIFDKVDTARQLEKELAQVTSTELQNSALDQDALVSSVIVQTISIGGVVILIVVVASMLVTGSIATPLSRLNQAAQQVEQGNLNVEVPVTTRDEVGQLAQTFNSMAGQLRNILETLEQQVKERTRGLAILNTINDQLAGILDIDQLLDAVVNQVRDNFSYYHVHVYTFDQAKEKLVVVAGTGWAGATMKANRHSIDTNAKSLVARAVRNATVVSIANVHQENDWLPNPLLPDTKSEIAVPIILEGQAMGVLDVQEDKIDAFDGVSIDLLKSVADQVAVGLRNAQQFEQVQSALAELQTIQKHYLEQSWDKSSLSRFTSAHADVRLADETTESTPVLTLPVEFRQVTIGSLELEASNPQRVWSDDEMALINAVLDQVVQAAENLRLFEETRERAGRERLIGQISDKLRRVPDIETLMKVGVEELSRALRSKRTFIQLGMSSKPNDNATELASHPAVDVSHSQARNGMITTNGHQSVAKNGSGE
ncbi:MAG: GAF domain-containing protein [Anaerolineae bacterium]|nr:GAF domain-containing protein [Anaerolineae bacterium]